MDRRKTKISQPFGDKVFDVINYFILSVMLLIFILPLWFVLVSSISDPFAVWRGEVFLTPVGFSLAGYKHILQYKNVWIGYRNTIFYTVVGTAVNLVVTLSAAYPLSRKEFAIKGFLMKVYMFTMYFSGGLIPSYLLIKNLGIMNTVWVMILPGTMSVWNLILTRTYLQSNIPQELYDSAALDGCNNFIMLFKIVLPLSSPIIAVMGLFYGVSHWNAYFNALIYLSDRNLYPLQLILREVLIYAQYVAEMFITVDTNDQASFQRIAETMKYGLIVVASLPILAIYPFVQKYFVKGIMIGSIKG